MIEFYNLEEMWRVPPLKSSIKAKFWLFFPLEPCHDNFMNMNFNENSEKPKFIYRHNPVNPNGFQIFMYKDEKEDYEPVGEYVLIDTQEQRELTEKKVMNLLSLMNGRKRLIDLSDISKSRVLYTILPDSGDDLNKKVIFRTYDGTSISKENAILTIEKGVFPDE